MDRLLAQALLTVPEGIFAASVLQLRAERAAMSGRYADAEADLRTARGALAGIYRPAVHPAAGLCHGRSLAGPG